jgi:hypothetical protein
MMKCIYTGKVGALLTNTAAIRMRREDDDDDDGSDEQNPRSREVRIAEYSCSQ